MSLEHLIRPILDLYRSLATATAVTHWVGTGVLYRSDIYSKFPIGHVQAAMINLTSKHTSLASHKAVSGPCGHKTAPNMLHCKLIIAIPRAFEARS